MLIVIFVTHCLSLCAKATSIKICHHSNLHRETDLMRRRLDVHQTDLKECKLQLSTCLSDQKSIGTTVADTYTVSTDVLALIDARGQMSNLGTEGLINSLLSTRAAIETRLNGESIEMWTE